MQITRLIRETLTLRDGRRVILRPIRPDDADRLRELHSRLSPHTRYLRFFGPKPVLSKAEAEYLAGVDFQERFAIVACISEEGSERIVGVGRFDLQDEGRAEAAVVVRDDYQGAGLGSALLHRMLEVARGRGVREFTGEVLANNHQMLRLLRANGVGVGEVEGSVVRVAVPIESGPFVLKVLRIVAEGLAAVAGRLRPRPPEGGSGPQAR